MTQTINIYCVSWEELLSQIKSESIDLIHIDPPYNISHSSGFSGISEQNILGKKFTAYTTDFGDWDKPIDLERLFKECYRVLRKGGTIICWYAEWKMQELKYYADEAGFKQARLCFWLKCNPVPINQKVNYLTNGYETFATFVKGSKPTFNSAYDNGVYQYPILHGKERTEHTTQKPLYIVENLIKKHSNPGDIVLDCFLGSGTTAVACKNTGRSFVGSDISEKYIAIASDRLNNTNN